MERKLVITEDGSHTLYVEGLNEHYHSTHGALQESMHIYIGHGLKPLLEKGIWDEASHLNIFEMGFGTGLNTLLTILEAGDVPIYYAAVEAYPLTIEEITALNYIEEITHPKVAELFRKIHDSPWGQEVKITPTFTLLKVAKKLIDADFFDGLFDLVYYDAFAPLVQPDLWTKEMLYHVQNWMADNSVLVTYCAKGEVKRILASLGFSLSHPAGPPGKKEITVAVKQ